jgi:hypothetical protein
LASSTTIKRGDPAETGVVHRVGEATGDGLAALGVGLDVEATEVEPHEIVAITTAMPSAPRHGIPPW